jgi:hypothetical protein
MHVPRHPLHDTASVSPTHIPSLFVFRAAQNSEAEVAGVQRRRACRKARENTVSSVWWVVAVRMKGCGVLTRFVLCCVVLCWAGSELLLALNKEDTEKWRVSTDEDLEIDAWIQSNEKRVLADEPGEAPISEADISAMEHFYTEEMSRLQDPLLELPSCNARPTPSSTPLSLAQRIICVLSRLVDPNLAVELEPFFHDPRRTRKTYSERTDAEPDPTQEKIGQLLRAPSLPSVSVGRSF